jgi:preprotein translocase subunit SecB
MRQSPLIIESYYLRRLEYRLKEEFEFSVPDGTPKTVDPKIQVHVESGHNKEDDNDWRIVIDVTGGEEPEFPYVFGISFAGYFRVAENYPKDQRETLVRVNGPSVLFAAAREFLSIVTARSPYPSIMLPSISFFPNEQSKKSGKKARPIASKTARKSPKKNASNK